MVANIPCNPRVGPPLSYTKRELGLVRELIEKGGEVNIARLPDHLNHCHLVGTFWVDGMVIAVGAIKVPRRSYVENIASSSGVAEVISCRWELGYLSTLEHERGKGLGTALVKELVRRVPERTFATVRVGNGASEDLLSKFEFVQQGEEWPSSEHPEGKVRVWLRGFGVGRRYPSANHSASGSVASPEPRQDPIAGPPSSGSLPGFVSSPCP